MFICYSILERFQGTRKDRTNYVRPLTRRAHECIISNYLARLSTISASAFIGTLILYLRPALTIECVIISETS